MKKTKQPISLGVASPLGDEPKIKPARLDWKFGATITPQENWIYEVEKEVNEDDAKWVISFVRRMLHQAITQERKRIKSLLPSRLDPVSKEDIFEKIDEVLSHLKETI